MPRSSRSRIKQQSERRTQKEFFERKRLLNKVKRIKPSSPGDSKSKKHISQDLLLLRTLTHTRDSKQHEHDAVRPVHVVNLEAKRPAFQQKLDLELPMSPIEKPSSLDFMDSSSLSLYQDLPRMSTEKIPQPCTTACEMKEGLVKRQCGATPLAPNVLPISKPAHKKVKPMSILSNSSPLDVPKFRLNDNCMYKMPFDSKRENCLDSKSVISKKCNDLLRFHQPQMLNFKGKREETSTNSGSGVGYQCSNLLSELVMDQKEIEKSKEQQRHALHNQSETNSDFANVTFNESVVGPLLKRRLANHKPNVAEKSTHKRLSTTHLAQKPTCTFQDMILNLEKACDTRMYSEGAGTPHGCQQEVLAVGRHREWRDFMTSENSGETCSNMSVTGSNNVTYLTEQPIPTAAQMPHKEASRTALKRHAEDPYRNGALSPLGKLLCLEVADDDDVMVLASQDFTLAPETEDPFGDVRGKCANTLKTDKSTREESEKGLSIGLDLKFSETQTRSGTSACSKGYEDKWLASRTTGNIANMEACTQTEPMFTKIYKEVSCGCDRPLPGCYTNRSTQTEAVAEISKPELRSTFVQTAKIHSTTSFDKSPIDDVILSASLRHNRMIQCLQQNESNLKEELGRAQSTIVWQSLIIRCLQDK